MAVNDGRETILLVEDQKGVRAFTRSALEDIGYHVLDAGDGDDAIAMAEGHPGPIHVLLTDLNLPGLDGRAVGERLKAMRPGLKVIVMSGYPGDFLGKSNSQAFLPKPYGPVELADKVRQVLGKS